MPPDMKQIILVNMNVKLYSWTVGLFGSFVFIWSVHVIRICIRQRC